MPSDDFWSVELGRGMGPLVFGLSRDEVIQRLRNEKIDTASNQDYSDPELYVEEIETMVVFAVGASHSLKRLDIEDERLRFGPVEVIGKPVHEIVELLKVPSSETLWCDSFDDEQPSGTKTEMAKAVSDKDLIKSGTLWITSLGLGLSLFQGEVVTVHLCDPDDSPRTGVGTWTESQRLHSVTAQAVEIRSTTRKLNPVSVCLNIGLMIAFGILIWRSVDLQKKWNEAPDVAAKVIAVKPPPPDPFPNEFTLSYEDFKGLEHQAVLGRMDYRGMAEVGDEITIRYLKEAPDKPLGPIRFRDVGVDFAVPYGVGILMVYSVLQISVSFSGLIRRIRKR